MMKVLLAALLLPGSLPAAGFAVDFGAGSSTVGFLLRGSEALDVDDNGDADISDPIRLLAHLFTGAPPPPGPFPGCGTDPTPDALGCASFPPCR